MTATPAPAIVDELRRLLPNSHAPYSGVHVSCVVEDAEGRLHGGVNVENAAYPQDICAEGSAITAMVTQGGKVIARVFVTSNLDEQIWPCGGCRQKIFELAAPGCEVVTIAPSGETGSRTIEELLPLGFRLTPR